MNGSIDRLKYTGPYAVFVPREDSSIAEIIDRGSGIVGVPYGEDRILLYFEGNRYGAANMVTFADRVLHAAGRLAHDAPTGALATVPEREVQQVGMYDPETGTVRLDDEESLAQWLGSETVEPKELVTTAMRHVQQRTLAEMRKSGDPKKRLEADFLEKHVLRTSGGRGRGR